jgi:hypothetical protein
LGAVSASSAAYFPEAVDGVAGYLSDREQAIVLYGTASWLSWI